MARNASGGSCADDASCVDRVGDVVATLPPHFHLALNYFVQPISATPSFQHRLK
jgi:hypothetical protein